MSHITHTVIDGLSLRGADVLHTASGEVLATLPVGLTFSERTGVALSYEHGVQPFVLSPAHRFIWTGELTDDHRELIASLKPHLATQSTARKLIKRQARIQGALTNHKVQRFWRSGRGSLMEKAYGAAGRVEEARKNLSENATPAEKGKVTRMTNALNKQLSEAGVSLETLERMPQSPAARYMQGLNRAASRHIDLKRERDNRVAAGRQAFLQALKSGKLDTWKREILPQLALDERPRLPYELRNVKGSSRIAQAYSRRRDEPSPLARAHATMLRRKVEGTQATWRDADVRAATRDDRIALGHKAFEESAIYNRLMAYAKMMHAAAKLRTKKARKSNYEKIYNQLKAGQTDAKFRSLYIAVLQRTEAYCEKKFTPFDPSEAPPIPPKPFTAYHAPTPRAASERVVVQPSLF